MPAADQFATLVDFAAVIEDLTSRTLKDGRRIYLRPQMFNVRLVVAVDIYSEDGWCFQNMRAAMEALATWDPETEDEPAGWIKHPATGRRRVSIFCGTCGSLIGALEYKRW